MLSTLVLIVLLSLSKAQWPLQSIGYEDVRPIPRPPSQPGYPYDVGRHFGEVPINSERNLPESIERKLKDPFEESKFLTASFKEATNVKKADEKINNLSALKFPVLSASSKIANITLTSVGDVRDKISILMNQESALRNDTDFYMKEFNLLYLNLTDPQRWPSHSLISTVFELYTAVNYRITPQHIIMSHQDDIDPILISTFKVLGTNDFRAIDESDNEEKVENIYKYGMSLILRFLLEFYRIFRKFTSQSNHLQLTYADAYGLSYNRAVAVMKQKKHYTPLQISAPVRRSSDIFKSIIYESVSIVQTKCSTLDPNWKCLMLYLANLISESLNCSNVWYHAFIHLLALESRTGIQDSIIYKIADLDKFNEFVYFENVFDFVIEKLQEYREEGRVQLSAKAVFFSMLADLQENGFLDCVSLDYLYN